MSINMEKAKQDVLWGCGRMVEKGYALGTAGNISARVAGEDLFVITPTAMPYAALTEDDLVVGDMQGNIVSGKYQPSIEFSMHLGIMQLRPEVHAVIHTHSKCATAISAMEGIHTVPMLDIEGVVYLGGELEIAPFAPPGSKELADHVKNTIGTNAGLIMANHGAIGVGVTMEEAMIASDNVERASEMYLQVLAAGLKLRALPDEYVEMTKKRSLLRRKVVNG